MMPVFKKIFFFHEGKIISRKRMNLEYNMSWTGDIYVNAVKIWTFKKNKMLIANVE